MNPPRLAGIILAAGMSARMRRLKPLLPLGDTTVTGHVIATLQNAGVEVLLVLGYRHQEIEAAVKNRPSRVVYNPDYEQGMFSSVCAGVRRLDPGCRAFFILPVDIPLVKTDTIQQLVDAGKTHPENIVYPVFNGQRGHPPLIPSSLIPGILGWKKEGGLKTFLQSYEKSALDVPVNDRFILVDIDTLEDYRKILKEYQPD